MPSSLRISSRSADLQPGSARVSGVHASPARTFGVSPKRSFLKTEIKHCRARQGESSIAGRNRQHARRVRYPELSPIAKSIVLLVIVIT